MAVSISKVWNTDENYWLMNPIMKTIKVFREFFEQDKSKNKDKSSKIMWAIALYKDPNDYNPWRNTSDIDKKILIAEDYLLDKKFNWEDHFIESLIDAYENFCLTIGEKELVRYELKLSDRGNFLHKTHYSLDEYDEETGKVNKGTADQLDKMMVNTVKIYEQYDLIKGMLTKEQSGQTRGGSKESAAETGKI